MEKLADISGFESLTTVTGNSVFNFSGGTKVSRLHAFNEYEGEEQAAEATEHCIPSKFMVDWPAESDWYRKEPHEGWDSVERGLLMKIMGQQMVDVGENTFNMGVDMLMDEGVSAKEISQYTAEKMANLSVNRKLTAQLGLENLVSAKPDDDPFEVYDKAAWHIDGGEDADGTVNQLASLFETLHDRGMLSEEGEEMYKSGIDSSASLHSRMVTPEGREFLNNYYKSSKKIDNSRTYHRNKVSLTNRGFGGFGGFGGFDLGSRGGDVRERKHLDEGIESRHLSDEKQPVHGGTQKELHDKYINKVTPVDGKYGKWASEIPVSDDDQQKARALLRECKSRVLRAVNGVDDTAPPENPANGEEEHIKQGDWVGFAKAAGIDIGKLLGKNY